MTPLFSQVEAARGAVILAEGIVAWLPRSLELRPGSPALSDTPILPGMPSVRPNPPTEAFGQLL